MIKSIIIDNDENAILHLSSLINKYSDVTIIDTFSNPNDAFKIIISKNIQVIFIELNLHNFNGFDFIKKLPKEISLVVVSNVKEYAIEAFELDVLDYLIKPISQDRFLNTLSRIYKTFNNSEAIVAERTSVYVKVDKKMVKIYHDQILFIEAVGDYIKIVCKEANFISNNTLKRFTSELPQEDFLRVHRSYSISTDRVTALEGNFIEIGNHKIPVGRQYIRETRERIIN